MKFIVLISSFLASAFVNAQPVELLPVMAPGLSVTWQYDTVIPYPGAEEPFQWKLSITPNVEPSNYKKMKWNLVDKKTGTIYFKNWQSFAMINSYSVVFKVSQDKALYDFLPAVENYQIVLSPNEKDSKYFVSISNLFKQYPGQFQDQTNPSNRLCKVEKSKLPDVDKECADWKVQLESYNLSCSETKKMYADTKICGSYSCK